MNESAYLAATLTVDELDIAKKMFMDYSDAGHSQFKAIGMIYRSAFYKGVNHEKTKADRRFTREEVDRMISSEADRRVTQAIATYKAKFETKAEAVTDKGENVNE